MANRAEGRILIIDDDASATRVLSAILAEEGMQTLVAPCSATGKEILRCQDIDAVITDLKMPDIDSIELLDFVQRSCPEVPVIILTAYGSPDSAAWAMSLGAFYYFLKPPDYSLLKAIVTRAVETKRLKCQLREMERENLWQETCRGLFPLVMAEPGLHGQLENCRHRQESVVIRGESGVGRQQIARALHRWRCGRGRPFVVLRREMEEGKGRRGSRKRKGWTAEALQELIGQASQGTLFLDNVDLLDSLAMGVLAQHLRCRSSQRGRDPVFRIIASTTRDLDAEAAAGRFNAELLQLIGALRLSIPPLRSRSAEIPLLAHAYVRELGLRAGRTPFLSPAAMAMLQAYPWPGNLRQLQAEIDKAAGAATGQSIDKEHLSPEIADYPPARATCTLKQLEAQAILQALEASRGNKSRTARRLGLSRKTLYKRLKELTPVTN
ncbi:MAG: response regulator [Desulfuromonadales bacterium]